MCKSHKRPLMGLNMQFKTKDNDKACTMGLLIHGDAAFSGLGDVSEVMQMSRVPGYKCDPTLALLHLQALDLTTRVS